jgi:hypothetical protein
MEKNRNGYRILVGKSEGRKLLLRPGCGFEDDINKDFKETRWEGMECVYLSLLGMGGVLL